MADREKLIEDLKEISNDVCLSGNQRAVTRRAITALSAPERPVPTLPESSVDYQQQRGVAWDIIDQAINTYDGWMLDDDYRASEVLREIINKMRSRRDAFLPKEASATPEPVQAAGDGAGEPFAYAYRYHDCIRFNGGPEVNGGKPIEAIPMYTKEQLAAAFSAGAAEMKRAIRQAEPEFHGSGKLDDYNAGWDGGVIAYRYAIAAINPSDIASPPQAPQTPQEAKPIDGPFISRTVDPNTSHWFDKKPDTTAVTALGRCMKPGCEELASVETTCGVMRAASCVNHKAWAIAEVAARDAVDNETAKPERKSLVKSCNHKWAMEGDHWVCDWCGKDVAADYPSPEPTNDTLEAALRERFALTPQDIRDRWENCHWDGSVTRAHFLWLIQELDRRKLDERGA